MKRYGLIALAFVAPVFAAQPQAFTDGITFGQSTIAPTGAAAQAFQNGLNAQTKLGSPYIVPNDPLGAPGAANLSQDAVNGAVTGLGTSGSQNQAYCLSYTGTDPAQKAECDSIKMLSQDPITGAKSAYPLSTGDFSTALGALQNPAVYAPDIANMKTSVTTTPGTCTQQTTTNTTYQQESCFTYMQQVTSQNTTTTIIPPSNLSISCTDNITPSSTSSWSCQKSVPITHVCDDVVSVSVVQKQVCATPTITMTQGFQITSSPDYWYSNGYLMDAGAQLYNVGGSCNTDGTMALNVSINQAWLNWDPNAYQTHYLANPSFYLSHTNQSVTLDVSSGAASSATVSYAIANQQGTPEAIALTASWDGNGKLTVSSGLDSYTPAFNTPAGASNVFLDWGTAYLAPNCPAENPPVALNNGITLCYAASACPSGYNEVTPGFTEATQPPTGDIGQAWYNGAWYDVSSSDTVSALPGSVLTISGSVWSAYACPQGFTQTGSTCFENYGATGAYVCPTGTTLSGTQCVSSTTTSATPNYSCPAGTTLSGTQCVSTSTSSATGSYSCPAGQTLSGTQCVYSTSTGATANYSCPSGTTLSGSQCLSTSSYTAASSNQCPSGGLLISYGTSFFCVTQSQPPSTIYSCPSGGTLSGSTCDQTSTYSAFVSGYNCSNVPGTLLQLGSACYVYGYPLSEYGYCGPPMTGYSGGEFYYAGQMWCGSYNTGTPIYRCNSGDTLSGSTCYHTSTAAATGTTGCTAGAYVPGYNICAISFYSASLVYSCPSGGALSGTTCTTSSSSGASVTYSCPFGGTLSGSTCIVNNSTGATLTYSCPAGETLSGSTCTSTNTTGASVAYSCPSGATLSGSTCTTTSSTGATMNYACPSGGTLSGSTCTITANGSFTGSGPFLPANVPVPVCQGIPTSTIYNITGSSTTPTAVSGNSNGCSVWANM
jgi:hypothetical protein